MAKRHTGKRNQTGAQDPGEQPFAANANSVGSGGYGVFPGGAQTQAGHGIAKQPHDDDGDDADDGGNPDPGFARYAKERLAAAGDVAGADDDAVDDDEQR